MISVNQLTKSFRDIKAVDSISFEVGKGEIVGLLGPNGAGKTTTMRLITGFLYPDAGSVKVNGISVEDDPTSAQRHIGYLAENNPLYKDMLVSDMLSLSADLKGIRKSEKKSAMDFAVSAVSISDIFYRPIGELSKGYKQRVGMAMALLHQPDIMIMDETTEGLDPNQRTEIRGLIQKLSKERTIILSTHVMQEAQAVCNRLLIINKGRMVADGTPQDLMKVANREKALVADIEGNGVEFSLRNLEGAEHIDLRRTGNERFEARIIYGESAELQPAISKLANANGWIIWKIAEEEHKLEDVFHKLTSEF